VAAPLRRPAVLGALLALALLLWAAPSPGSAVADLRAPSSAADVTAPLVAVVALLAWALAGWLLLTVVLTLLSRAPGAAGRVAAALARRVAPVALRRLVGAALGVTVAVGALAGPAAAASAGPPAVPAPVAGTASLDWPGTAAAPEPDPQAVAGQAPDLDWPAGEPAGPAPVLGSATSSGEAADAVVVQPGDTLWQLAEQRLAQQQAAPSDRDVAAAWPAWWAANREVVGEDPHLLRPGTSLQPPAPDTAPPTDQP
jgi:hypothetical protein